MRLPEKIVKKISLSEDEFEQLDPKIQICIIRLASENIELEELLNERMIEQFSIATINVAFMAVGMRFRGDHKFSKSDVISLEREDDNPTDKNAIKIFADGKHVAYVSKEYTHELRSIPNFEQGHVQLIANFPQSAKLELSF
jgi:hypothetical protein